MRPSFTPRRFGRHVTRLVLLPTRAGLTGGNQAEPGTAHALSPR